MNLKLTIDTDIRQLANVLIVLSENIDRIDEIPDMVKLEKPVSGQKTRTEKPVAAQPTETEPAKDDADKPVAASAIGLEDIRIIVKEKSGLHKAAIAALLKEYKAKTLPDLKENDYPSFYEKMLAL